MISRGADDAPALLLGSSTGVLHVRQISCSVLQCVVVCCSVLQRAVGCCRVLLCVAVR